nr:WecB/TagA/CpsF family glycosyltransferase [uncultured Emticicia sp.]
MKVYFNVKLEFDKKRVNETIENAIFDKTKGYVCSIESNNLTVANKNIEFLTVVNNALVNICDGSMLSKILSFIYKENFASYIGADLFLEYIYKCKYRHFFLGNTAAVLEGLKQNMSKIDLRILEMRFEELPFRTVENFDYQSIGNMINEDKPDIIWVSLGAPKQEFFMGRLLPYLDQGVMFGFGAIFNFNSGVGSVKRAPHWMRKMKLEWFYRAIEEPKKNVPRYWGFIRLLPKLILQEYKRIKIDNSKGLSS